MQTFNTDAWTLAVDINAHSIFRPSNQDKDFFRVFAIGDTRLFFSGGVNLKNPLLIAQMLGMPSTTDEEELFCRGYLAGGPYKDWLHGEFGFALYDQGKNTLILGRDPLGLGSLYYYCNSGLYIASNSLDQILSLKSITTSTNEKVVANWCVNGSAVTSNETFFREIHKCPPATILQITSSGVHAAQYWNSADIKPLIYQNEREYSEHLRDLIETVINEKNYPHAHVGAHLSGGLDSSAIAIIAGRKIRSSGHDFHTFNWCQPHAGDLSRSHEWSDARAIAQVENFLHQETGITSTALKHDLLHHDISRDGTAMFYYESEVLVQAQARGIKTILSGFGGDEGITCRSRDLHYQEIRSGHFQSGFKKLALEMNPNQNMFNVKLARSYGSLLFRSFWPNQASKRQRDQDVQLSLQNRLELLKPEFADYARGYWHDYFNHYLEAQTIHEKQQILLNSGCHQERIESWSIAGRRRGIQYRYPYLDQRIIEFALAIPSDLYFRQGRARHLYLESLKDVLPESLLSKSKLAEHYRVRHLMEQFQAALSDEAILEKINSTDSPYINRRNLLKKIREVQQLDRDQLLQQSNEALDVVNAVHTLSINGGT